MSSRAGAWLALLALAASWLLAPVAGIAQTAVLIDNSFSIGNVVLGGKNNQTYRLLFSPASRFADGKVSGILLLQGPTYQWQAFVSVRGRGCFALAGLESYTHAAAIDAALQQVQPLSGNWLPDSPRDLDRIIEGNRDIFGTLPRAEGDFIGLPLAALNQASLAAVVLPDCESPHPIQPDKLAEVLNPRLPRPKAQDQGATDEEAAAAAAERQSANAAAQAEAVAEQKAELQAAKDRINALEATEHKLRAQLSELSERQQAPDAAIRPAQAEAALRLKLRDAEQRRQVLADASNANWFELGERIDALADPRDRSTLQAWADRTKVTAIDQPMLTQPLDPAIVGVDGLKALRTRLAKAEQQMRAIEHASRRNWEALRTRTASVGNNRDRHDLGRWMRETEPHARNAFGPVEAEPPPKPADHAGWLLTLTLVVLLNGVATLVLARVIKRAWPARPDAGAQPVPHAAGPAADLTPALRSTAEALLAAEPQALLAHLERAATALDQAAPAAPSAAGTDGAAHRRRRALLAEVQDRLPKAIAAAEALAEPNPAPDAAQADALLRLLPALLGLALQSDATRPAVIDTSGPKPAREDAPAAGLSREHLLAFIAARLRACGYLRPGEPDPATLEQALRDLERDEAEHPERSDYACRMVRLRDLLATERIQARPAFAACELGALAKELAKKTDWRLRADAGDLSGPLLGHWYAFLERLYRAHLLLLTFWPAEDELADALGRAAEAADRLLRANGLHPHRLRMLATEADLARPPAVLPVTGPPPGEPPELRARVDARLAKLRTAAPVSVNIITWGIDQTTPDGKATREPSRVCFRARD
jgi:hypothetical protein